MKQFPDGFFWGTATAAYQIEGSTRVDGRGESIWDRFAARPGRILTGESGEPACESYLRYREDVAWMKRLNANAYRFSVAWPRVVPDGDGVVNEKGLDYYSRLVDELLEAGIEPFLTLYHWDLPQALQDRGGWSDRATIDAFLRYVEKVVNRLGDRVTYWMTHNEPWCISILSNQIGDHAPGLSDTKTALAVAHHLLVSHGKAVPIIRTGCPRAKVGMVLNFAPSVPATDSEEDRLAAEKHHETFNRWFVDPLAGRPYPRGAWAAYGDAVPVVRSGDLEAIQAPLDFLGVNFYSRSIIHDKASSPASKVIHRPNPRNLMARGWEVRPETLVELLHWLHQDYKFPALFITENGATYDDVVWDGEVHDLARLDYIKKHVSVLPDAIAAGIPLRGYFCWSLMDNFEWALGTHDRFGLIYVDFDTQQRLMKDSGKWFASVARANRLPD